MSTVMPLDPDAVYALPPARAIAMCRSLHVSRTDIISLAQKGKLDDALGLLVRVVTGMDDGTYHIVEVEDISTTQGANGKEQTLTLRGAASRMRTPVEKGGGVGQMLGVRLQTISNGDPSAAELSIALEAMKGGLLTPITVAEASSRLRRLGRTAPASAPAPAPSAGGGGSGGEPPGGVAATRRNEVAYRSSQGVRGPAERPVDKRLKETPTIGSRINERETFERQRPTAAAAAPPLAPPRLSPPTVPPLAPPPLAPPQAPPQACAATRDRSAGSAQTAAAAAAGATKPTARAAATGHATGLAAGATAGRWMGSGATARPAAASAAARPGAAAAARLGSAASWTVAPEAPPPPGPGSW